MKLLAIFFAFLIATSASLAFGVSPAKKVFDTPGNHSFSITARHEGEVGVVNIRAEGDLAQFISFDKTSALFTTDETFEAVIDVPPNIEPGDHTQKIVVSVTPQGSGVMSATVETVSLLVVRKEFPGPYLVAEV